MSLRYTGAWLQDGTFNPLTAPTGSPYLQYGGIWTTSQATDAVASGTWAVPPSPHLYAWGYNNRGQLGLGSITSYSSPKQVGSLTIWTKVGYGNGFTLAIKPDGTLWSWGYNNVGQLGLGNITSYSSPKQVGSLTNWSTVCNADFGGGGGPSSFAIKTDGTLWAWGQNSSGQLGLNNLTLYSSPIQVGSLTNWKYVSTGGLAVLAIKTNGTLWGWGSGTGYKLGLGNTTTYSSPTQVGSLTNWFSVCAGQQIPSGSLNVGIAVKTDGTMWTWGYSNSGGFGTGLVGYCSSPKQVGALTTWVSAASATESAIALKTDGTLWTWGKNQFGQLGQGNLTYLSSPKQVGSLTNWSKPTFGGNAAVLKTDGTLWVWGNNSQGQLGLGNTTYCSSPKQVGSLTNWLSVTAGYYFTLAIAKT